MLPWLARAAWLALPFTVGATVADALDGRSAAVQVTAAGLLWAGWALVVVALLVPRPAGLVGLRSGALAAVGLAAWAADGSSDLLVAGTAALVALALALSAETGEWMVNGTSYGYERRYLLRAPGPVVLGPIVLTALALPASVLAGPMLLAARQWVPGALATAAGVVAFAGAFRALHAVTMRWVVLVPAGLVLKDHLTIADPVLFRRADIEVLRHAPAGTDALDLTAGALGLALEVGLRERQRIERVRPARRGSEAIDVLRFLVTPTRPRALLADARGRRIRVEDARP